MAADHPRRAKPTLFDRNSGALILVALGFCGAVFGYGQRYDTEDLAGSHQWLDDTTAMVVMGLSVAVLVAGAVWAIALRRPAQPRAAVRWPDASAWTGWIPRSDVVVGEEFRVLVPARITDADGRTHHVVGTPEGEHVRIGIRIPTGEDRGSSFTHDVDTKDGQRISLRFNVFPPEIGAVAAAGESERDPVEGAMARLLSHPEIEAALASFDLLEYRAACDRLLASATDASERSALSRLRRTRRFFGWNQGPAPVMPTLTVNGFGFRLFGSGDRHDDTYVATNWVTLLYLPVWPTRSFVLFDDGEAPLSEVPTDPRLRWAVLSIVGVLVATAGIIELLSRGHG